MTALVLFHHIEKTAGTALRSWLEQHLAPSASLYVPDDQVTADLDDYEKRQNKIVHDFIAEQRRQPCSIASGHLRNHHVLWIRAAFPKTKVITILREPFERVASHYRYMLSDDFPLAPRFPADFPTFPHFFHQVHHRNVMTRALAGNFAEACDSISISSTYAFVALQERLAESVTAVGTLLGFSGPHNLPRLRATDHSVGGDVDKYKADVLRLNAEDVLLYEHWSKAAFSA